jgi:hypothetical protein
MPADELLPPDAVQLLVREAAGVCAAQIDIHRQEPLPFGSLAIAEGHVTADLTWWTNCLYPLSSG